MESFGKHGFTLIELLIVVAIIAILAAIAVPNFLEAQTRAKVARVKGEMLSMSTALECYCVDNNLYPATSIDNRSCECCWQHSLTTPVAFMTYECKDIFTKNNDPDNYFYQYALCQAMKSWIFVSVGPDQTDNFDEENWMCGMANRYPMPYDPTNGTVSEGDIRRVNRQWGAELYPSSCWHAESGSGSGGGMN